MSEIIVSDKISELSKALAKAQGEFPAIPKDSKVEVKNKEGKFLYAYKYADLTTIISVTRPAMSKAGLSFTQGVYDGGFATKIMHESGETLITGFIPFEIPKGVDMKTIGGLITYVKRISLTAALGVSADEDVDYADDEGRLGNTTDKTSIHNPPREEPKRASLGPTEPQLKRLEAIARKAGYGTQFVIDKVMKDWKLTVQAISPKQYNEICEWLEKNPAKAYET
jgi:hypothetical protein